jgi:mannose-6-phosphate isomerase-like protein (cupin superfamily)
VYPDVVNSPTKKPRILLSASAAEYFFDEGCYITEWSNSPDDADASIARARVVPGVTTRWHSLTGIVERYVILQGEGSVEVGNLPAMPVESGDVVVIPAGTRQRIRNAGTVDLVFLAVCTPRFVVEAYVDLET